MVFTAAQVALIRSYLGYPSILRQSNPRLESAIAIVGNDSDTSAADQVTALLTTITGVLTTLGSTGLQTAGVEGLDKGDVSLYEGATIRDICNVGRIYVTQLSVIFSVPVVNDIFSGGGYSGDAWARGNGRAKLTGIM